MSKGPTRIQEEKGKPDIDKGTASYLWPLLIFFGTGPSFSRIYNPVDSLSELY